MIPFCLRHLPSLLRYLAPYLAMAGVWLGLSGCYLTQQAYYQNNLINSRLPVSHVLADPATPEDLKDKLKLLEKVKAYAALQGLNSEGAYDSFVDNGQGAMSYLVFAAPIDELTSKTWWFPVVGSVPYLGFFQKADRDEEAAELERQGFDVYRAQSMAFSSLGYFEDPVYSSQFKYSDRMFSHTIFHELVHRTIWVPGSTSFNENLAEFVADQLNHQFIGANVASPSSGLLDKRVARKKTRIAFVDEAKDKLRGFYQGRGRKLLAESRSVFLQEREKILAATYKKYYNPSDSHHRRWNNASLLAASLYLPDYDIFAKAFACTGQQVPAFIAALKRATTELRGQSPTAILSSLCPANETVSDHPRRIAP